MVTTWFAGFLLLWDAGYEPRHRSKRQVGAGIGRLAQRKRECPGSAEAGQRLGSGLPDDGPWMSSPAADPEFGDQLASNRLHRMLEGCALDDIAQIIPEMVQVIARSSAETMTSAWNDFREAAWNARALRVGPRLWAEPFDEGHLTPCSEEAHPYLEETDPYPEEDAVVIKFGQARDALWLITNAPDKHAVRSS
jgi:hypothetical protein